MRKNYKEILFLTSRLPISGFSPALCIRRFKITDLETFFHYQKNELIHQNQGSSPVATLDEARQRLLNWMLPTNSDAPVFAVELDGKLVGGCSLILNIRHESVEIGYEIDPLHWGRGIGTAVASRLVEFCFMELGANRVEGICWDQNKASGRVLEKAGLLFEGLHKEKVKVKDRFWDLHYYGLTRRKFMEVEEDGNEENVSG